MDLKKLKTVIDQKKSEKIQISQSLGETVALPARSDVMLHELLLAHNSGKENNAIKKIKAVDQLTETKKPSSIGAMKGDGLTDSLGSFGSVVPQQQQVQMMNERDTMFEQKLNNMSLSQSLGNFQQPQYNPNIHQPIPNQQYYQQSQVMNEQVINEAVNRALNENIAVMVQEVMKSVIIEMYEADKMKNSILENKDMIKKIVRETIIELSQQNKKQVNK